MSHSKYKRKDKSMYKNKQKYKTRKIKGKHYHDMYDSEYMSSSSSFHYEQNYKSKNRLHGYLYDDRKKNIFFNIKKYIYLIGVIVSIIMLINIKKITMFLEKLANSEKSNILDDKLNGLANTLDLNKDDLLKPNIDATIKSEAEKNIIGIKKDTGVDKDAIKLSTLYDFEQNDIYTNQLHNIDNNELGYNYRGIFLNNINEDIYRFKNFDIKEIQNLNITNESIISKIITYISNKENNEKLNINGFLFEESKNTMKSIINSFLVFISFKFMFYLFIFFILYRIIMYIIKKFLFIALSTIIKIIKYCCCGGK